MDSLLYETKDNRPPPDHWSGRFESFDGTRLRYAVFRGTAGPARGTIVLLHGRGEYIEKYYETIAELTAMGFWVATFDWRGQGGSGRLLKDPLKGYVRRFGDYRRDLDVFLRDVVLPDTRLPFYLLAHSTGALVALDAAPELASRIARIVVLAPFVALGAPGWRRFLTGLVARLCCLVGLGRLATGRYPFPRPFADNPLTGDRGRFDRNTATVGAHPVLRLGAPTMRWLREALAAIERVNAPDHLSAIAVPTLIVGATRDTIVPMTDLEDLAGRFRAGHLLAIDGARHELLQERDLYREQTLAAIDAFLAEDAPTRLEPEGAAPDGPDRRGQGAR